MRISSDGNLELIQSKNLYWKHQGGGTIRAGITADSSDNLTFSTGSSDTTRMTLDGSGNVGIDMAPDASVKLSVSGAVGTTNGSVSSPTHTFYGDPDTGMFRAAANTLGLTAGTVEQFRMSDSGGITVNDAQNTNVNFIAKAGSSTNAFQVDGSSGAVTINEAGIDADFRVESDGNSYMLYVDAGNDAVIIGDNNRSTSDSGLSVVGTVIDNISIQYKGTAGGHNSKLSFVDKRDQVNAIVQNNLINDGAGTAGAHLEFLTTVSGTLSERLKLGGGVTYEAVFNDDSLDYDFRIESDNNSYMLFVDAGANTANLGNDVFGEAPTVTSGKFVHFNTTSQTVASGGSSTVNLFTRSPDADVSATGTVFIAAENSGGTVQFGAIIDFFFSNGTLNTTARETGSSQGTATMSVQENGAAISVTVAYAGGLGGAIKFNAGGQAAICSY
jgi:hypothetical protein